MIHSIRILMREGGRLNRDGNFVRFVFDAHIEYLSGKSYRLYRCTLYRENGRWRLEFPPLRLWTVQGLQCVPRWVDSRLRQRILEEALRFVSVGEAA